MIGEGKQSDVFVVDDVLRVLEAIVGAQEVFSVYFFSRDELANGQDDVEDLSRSLIVVRQASLTQFPRCTVELPVDTLHCDEHQPQQLVENYHYKILNQHPIACESHHYSPPVVKDFNVIKQER